MSRMRRTMIGTDEGGAPAMTRTIARPRTVITLFATLALATSVSLTSASAASPTPEATSPGVAGRDFLYQTRVGDGLGVFASVGGQVQRVDEGAPGTRHKHPIWTNDGSQVPSSRRASGTPRGPSSAAARCGSWIPRVGMPPR